jgi:hypothetical protein
MNRIYFKFFTNSNKAKIQFIGKRSSRDTSKHILNNQKNEEVAKIIIKPVINLKISPTSSHIFRPSISKEEIEEINNGGVLNIKDWTKIKIKKKSLNI